MTTEITSARQHQVIALRPSISRKSVGQLAAPLHAVPRYTSYPTADRFVEAFACPDYERYLSNCQTAGTQSLGLYVHIPYCRSLCYYCACNKQVSASYKVSAFLDALDREMELLAARLGNTPFAQMHWGGGTPTFLNCTDIERVFECTRRHFNFLLNADNAIEIDPRTVDGEKIRTLASLGFKRASLGVQDFDLHVQKKINRIQPVEMVDDVLRELRGAGIDSINFDLITGLPLQSVASFSKTLDQVIAFKPDRLAMYNFAHLPERFKAQRLLEKSDLPGVEERQAIFDMSTEKLLSAGYQYIGMDHFALPGDELAIAQRSGRLHRNFQGYTTQGECDLIGIGPSAISKVGGCYSQNKRSVRDYIDALDEGELPVDRGIELTRDDLLRRSVISAIMCQNFVDKQSVEAANLIDFDDYFRTELEQLKQMEDTGWVTLSDDSFSVTNHGRSTALRNVAFVFDKYAQKRISRQSNSRVI